MLFIRLNSQTEKKLKEYAEAENMSVAEYVQNIINEKLEDLYDAKIAEETYEEFLKNPVAYTYEELVKRLDLE